MPQFIPLLFNFLGRNHPSFFGTPRGCYLSYLKFCEKKDAAANQIIRTERCFHRERKARGIGVEMGYVNYALLSLLSDAAVMRIPVSR